MSVQDWKFRVKGRDPTQSYNKSPYHHKKIQNTTQQNKHTQETSIQQRLRTDLGRSVGITIANQLVWLNRLAGPQPSHSQQQLCNRGHEHAGIIL